MKDPKATVRLLEQTLRDLKAETARKGTTIQEVLEKAINKFLTQPKSKSKL